MYYLNSDGTLDTSGLETTASPAVNDSASTDNYSRCDCDLCLRKRKKKCYKWFSWINIALFLAVLFVIFMLTRNQNINFKSLFGGGASTSSSSSLSDSSYKQLESSSSYNDKNGNEFELPLL